jgi:hypothetical protein
MTSSGRRSMRQAKARFGRVWSACTRVRLRAGARIASRNGYHVFTGMLEKRSRASLGRGMCESVDVSWVPG